MATKDVEGIWRGTCRNHCPNRFGGCDKYVFQEGTNRCKKCNCVARSHFAISKCKSHTYCTGYDETNLAGECANCGCTVAMHTIADHESLPPATARVSLPAGDDGDASNGAKNVWSEVAKAAQLERKKMQETCPPVRKGKKGHGGARVNSGRKKALYYKDVQVCPVRVKNRDLGTFSSCGKRIFVSLKGKPLTLETLEDESMKAVCGMSRNEAIGFEIDFFILKTLKGPRLEQDQHIQGSSFYLYCNTFDGPEQSLDDDIDPSLAGSFNSSKSSQSKTNFSTPGSVAESGRRSIGISPSTSNVAIPSTSFAAPPSSSIQAMAMRSRNNILRSLRRPAFTAQKRMLPEPSTMLGLGKSLALPASSDQGRVTYSVELYNFVVDDEWTGVTINGPESSMLTIQGYPANPFQSGTFQLAYHAVCANKCNSLQLNERLVFKQHKLEEYGVGNEDMIEVLTEDEIKNINIRNQKRTAKEAQITAVAKALCHHFNADCSLIPDFGRQISILPCYHVKLTSVHCPPWGVVEPFLGTSDSQPWYKFINNDGQEVDDAGPASLWPPPVKEFQLKAQCFAHWSYQKFKGKAFVCDLQGADFKLTDLEIASTDRSLFGIGNLSSVALNNFKDFHRCNVYCAALGLQDPILVSTVPRGEQSTETPSDEELEREVTFNPRHGQEETDRAGEVSHCPGNTLETDLQNETNTKPKLCNICLERKIDSVFYACGHTYACHPCAEKCAEMKTCPICRQSIREVVKLYF